MRRKAVGGGRAAAQPHGSSQGYIPIAQWPAPRFRQEGDQDGDAGIEKPARPAELAEHPAEPDRQESGLTARFDNCTLGKVRSEITTRDMEGLDGALSYLLKLLTVPANQAALAAQGHTPADTKAFADAQQ